MRFAKNASNTTRHRCRPPFVLVFLLVVLAATAGHMALRPPAAAGNPFTGKADAPARLLEIPVITLAETQQTVTL